MIGKDENKHQAVFNELLQQIDNLIKSNQCG